MILPMILTFQPIENPDRERPVLFSSFRFVPDYK
jgi:hypothetical protein